MADFVDKQMKTFILLTFLSLLCLLDYTNPQLHGNIDKLHQQLREHISNSNKIDVLKQFFHPRQHDGTEENHSPTQHHLPNSILHRKERNPRQRRFMHSPSMFSKMFASFKNIHKMAKKNFTSVKPAPRPPVNKPLNIGSLKPVLPGRHKGSPGSPRRPGMHTRPPGFNGRPGMHRMRPGGVTVKPGMHRFKPPHGFTMKPGMHRFKPPPGFSPKPGMHRFKPPPGFSPKPGMHRFKPPPGFSPKPGMHRFKPPPGFSPKPGMHRFKPPPGFSPKPGMHRFKPPPGFSPKPGMHRFKPPPGFSPKPGMHRFKPPPGFSPKPGMHRFKPPPGFSPKPGMHRFKPPPGFSPKPGMHRFKPPPGFSPKPGMHRFKPPPGFSPKPGMHRFKPPPGFSPKPGMHRFKPPPGFSPKPGMHRFKPPPGFSPKPGMHRFKPPPGFSPKPGMHRFKPPPGFSPKPGMHRFKPPPGFSPKPGMHRMRPPGFTMKPGIHKMKPPPSFLTKPGIHKMKPPPGFTMKPGIHKMKSPPSSLTKPGMHKMKPPPSFTMKPGIHKIKPVGRSGITMRPVAVTKKQSLSTKRPASSLRKPELITNKPFSRHKPAMITASPGKTVNKPPVKSVNTSPSKSVIKPFGKSVNKPSLSWHKRPATNGNNVSPKHKNTARPIITPARPPKPVYQSKTLPKPVIPPKVLQETKTRPNLPASIARRPVIGNRMMSPVAKTPKSVCKRPPYISNGQSTSLSQYHHGARVTYSCKPGYKLEGVATHVCQMDGQWSGSKPSCVKDDKKGLKDSLTKLSEDITDMEATKDGKTLIVVLVIVVALLLMTCHCLRVSKIRGKLKKKHKDVLEEGLIPTRDVPGLCEVSNSLLKKCFCCGKSGLPGSFRPHKSKSASSVASTHSLKGGSRTKISSKTNIRPTRHGSLHNTGSKTSKKKTPYRDIELGTDEMSPLDVEAIKRPFHAPFTPYLNTVEIVHHCMGKSTDFASLQEAAIQDEFPAPPDNFYMDPADVNENSLTRYLKDNASQMFHRRMSRQARPRNNKYTIPDGDQPMKRKHSTRINKHMVTKKHGQSKLEGYLPKNDKFMSEIDSNRVELGKYRPRINARNDGADSELSSQYRRTITTREPGGVRDVRVRHYGVQHGQTGHGDGVSGNMRRNTPSSKTKLNAGSRSKSGKIRRTYRYGVEDNTNLNRNTNGVCGSVEARTDKTAPVFHKYPSTGLQPDSRIKSRNREYIANKYRHTHTEDGTLDFPSSEIKDGLTFGIIKTTIDLNDDIFPPNQLDYGVIGMSRSISDEFYYDISPGKYNLHPDIAGTNDDVANCKVDQDPEFFDCLDMDADSGDTHLPASTHKNYDTDKMAVFCTPKLARVSPTYSTSSQNEKLIHYSVSDNNLKTGYASGSNKVDSKMKYGDRLLHDLSAHSEGEQATPLRITEDVPKDREIVAKNDHDKDSVVQIENELDLYFPNSAQHPILDELASIENEMVNIELKQEPKDANSDDKNVDTTEQIVTGTTPSDGDRTSSDTCHDVEELTKLPQLKVEGSDGETLKAIPVDFQECIPNLEVISSDGEIVKTSPVDFQECIPNLEVISSDGEIVKTSPVDFQECIPELEVISSYGETIKTSPVDFQECLAELEVITSDGETVKTSPADFQECIPELEIQSSDGETMKTSPVDFQECIPELEVQSSDVETMKASSVESQEFVDA